MKKLLIVLMFTVSCTPKMNKEITKQNSNLATEINESIIDGFFDNDTSKVPKNTYLIPNN